MSIDCVYFNKQINNISCFGVINPNPPQTPTDDE